MRKNAVVVTGAFLFGLGLMVAPGYAGHAVTVTTGGAVPTESISFTYQTIKWTYTVKACTGQGGTVVNRNGQQMCRLPNNHK